MADSDSGAENEGAGKTPSGWKRWLKRIAIGAGATLIVGAAGLGIYVYVQTSAFDKSVAKVYDIPPLDLARTDDPAAIARGKHLTESIAGCAIAECHSADFGGGKVVDAGPIGKLGAPNITSILPAYSDGELARLIRHGVRKDGRTVLMMTVDEFNWLPDSDVVAIISYLRTVPRVDRASHALEVGTLGKILDRQEFLHLDAARRVDHSHIEIAPAPSPTPAYGAYVVRLCTGCHGEKLSGGPIPGAPAEMAVPSNLTPHETGLAGWSYEDFVQVANTGQSKDGHKLDSMMPVEALGHMNDTEKHAIYSYLQALPPTPFGNR